jgi:hypothetical protein
MLGMIDRVMVVGKDWVLARAVLVGVGPNFNRPCPKQENRFLPGSSRGKASAQSAAAEGQTDFPDVWIT